MKAMVYTEYGSTNVLQLKDVEKPMPEEGEVLVKIMATAVNQADRHLLSGMLRFSSGLLKPKHPVLGSDIAGQVEAVGRKATQFRPGEAVFGDLSRHGRGGFAEYVAVPESTLAPAPANLTFVEAAAVPMTSVTALQGLRDKGNIQPGQQVLINGASGGVGTFAVQIAKAFAAEVTAVCSARKAAVVRSIGADHIIDYAQEDFTRNRHRYDLIFDTVAKHSLAGIKRALNPQGKYVSCAFSLGVQIMGPWISLTEGKKMSNMMAKPNQEDLLFMKTLIESAKVKPVIDRCYPLTELPEALQYVQEGQATGKVVVTIANPSKRKKE